MKHPSEKILEAVALDAGGTVEGQPEEVRRHFDECSPCREWVEYLRSFYRQFRRLPFSSSPALQSLIESVRPPPTVFALRPFQRWAAGEGGHARRTTILAAASDVMSTARYRRLGVLSSEEEGVVLRLIYDAQEDLVDVFLISSESRKRQHAIVSFPVLHLECVTDREGKSRFRGVKQVRDIAWATQYAVVRLPICEVPLPLEGEARHAVGEPESHMLSATVDAMRVSLAITPLQKQARPITTALLSDEGTQLSIVNLENGCGSVPVVGSPSQLVLRLYH